MMSRGLLDYLRFVGVLVRGIILNFFVVLPYFLLVAVILGYAHHWMLAHPFRLTLITAGATAAWTLAFPATIPLLRVFTQSRSIETGRENSVRTRDRYERTFGACLLAILAAALLESLPWALELVHDWFQLEEFSWQGGMATLAASVALFSSADKVLSLLGGLKKKLAMALFGLVGVLVPVVVILYVTDFIVYGLPASPLVMYSPVLVPVVGVVGCALAIPLGLWRRAFASRREVIGVVSLLVVAAALLVAVVYALHQARATSYRSLLRLDDSISALQVAAARFEDIPRTDDMHADVATLVSALAEANRRFEGERRGLQALFDQSESVLRQIRRPCDEAADLGLLDVWLCLPYDQLRAEWDRRYFSGPLRFMSFGRRLAAYSDEQLAPVRRELATLAHQELLAELRKTADDEAVAGALRRALVEFHVRRAPRPLREHPDDVTNPAEAARARFAAVSDDGRLRVALEEAKLALRGTSVGDIAALVGENRLAQRVAQKFVDVPGKADTARLGGRDELAKLLTAEELLDLVFEDERAPDAAARLYRARLLEDAVGGLPVESLAALAEADVPSEGAALNLALYFDTTTESPRIGVRDVGTTPEPMPIEMARAAGRQLARRALEELDLEHLKALAFDLRGAIGRADLGPRSDDPAREARPSLFEERRAEFDRAREEAVSNAESRDRLQTFVRLAQLPVRDLATRVFPPAPADAPASSLAPQASSGVVPDFPYQWPDDVRARALLAGRALAFETDALARLAREVLIERALAGAGPASERAAILTAFGVFPHELLTASELAGIAAARLRPGAAGGAGDLITSTMFRELARLEQGDLGSVKARFTEAVMPPNVTFVLLMAAVVWLGCWLTVDVNLTSIHGLYRDRLASAFLVGKDTDGRVGIEDDLDLDDICRYDARATAPYHLINAALNLQGSGDPNLRDRQSDFFIFSKRFVGGSRTGYCRSETLEQAFPQMSVASAMAVSAAAASPNMGRGTSPLLVGVMTLLNIRLGYWLPNPGRLEVPANDQGGRTPSAKGFTFEEVYAEELREIEHRRQQVYPHGTPGREIVGSAMQTPTVAHQLVGIGFSGGGIRSASFNLGVAQALDRAGVFDHLDYMSTVSGGGYLGSSLSTLMRSRESLTSEIDGTVTIGRASPTEECPGAVTVTVTPTSPDQEARTYRFAAHAALGVRDGQRIRAGTSLLRPRTARGHTDIDGTVVGVEAGLNGTALVVVQGLQPDERREYVFSRFDTVVVSVGQAVEAGDDLIRRHDTLTERFRWRVRPNAFLREMLSQLDEARPWVNVSDGGHIENLAAIELLRRRCKYIVLGDGEADPRLHFSGLATLMRCASIDLGVRIDIDLGSVRLRKPSTGFIDTPLSGAHWAVGTITYPPTGSTDQAETGYLLYVKSSYTDDETEIIREYRHRFPDFPHQTTADQAFDEDQFEAYRALGQHAAESALSAPSGMLPAGKMSFRDVEQWFADLRAAAAASMPDTPSTTEP